MRKVLVAVSIAAAGLVALSPTQAGALAAPAVGIASTPSGRGYWVAAADGGVFAFGDAEFHGSLGATRLNQPIVGIAASPTGGGYWLVARDGGVFTFGDAPFHGSMGGTRLNQPVVGIASSPAARGYWLVASDGGVFTFGDAPFHGSMGGTRLNQPVVGIAASPSGGGYWLVASDGGVFTFGDAPFHGSMGGTRLARAVVGIAATPSGAGYWLVASDGGVFTFGDAPFHGSSGGRVGPAVVGLAPTANAGGYRLVATDGEVLVFGEAAFLGAPPRDPPPPSAPNLRVEVAVSGLDIPWDVAFTPDGAMLFTERSGRVRAFIRGQLRTLSTMLDVFASGEAGLLGIAVDADFATTRAFWTCHTWTDSTRRDVRVVRWRVDESYLTAVRTADPLFSGMPAGSGRHNGCRPRVGPDGYLWVGTGDAAIGTNPQDRGSLGGKVLRVDGATGEPAPGNPFGSRVLTFGHRNVQGIAVRPGTSQVFSAEHGPDRDDEVNLIEAGRNYGWDPVPGYNESVPMTDLRKFPNAAGAVWSSGQPVIAASGATFLMGERWAAWNGALAVAGLRGTQLRILFLDAAGRLTGQATTLTRHGRLRTPTLGPDGNLYVTTSNGAGRDVILRVIPT